MSRKDKRPNPPKYRRSYDSGLPFEADTPVGRHELRAFKDRTYWVTPHGWIRVREQGEK